MEIIIFLPVDLEESVNCKFEGYLPCVFDKIKILCRYV